MKEIKLTQGKISLVDDEYYEELSKYKWYANKNKNTFYAMRNQIINGKSKTIMMHRQITNNNSNFVTDHIDGNGLNNQKSNLRIVTNRQNSQNRKNIIKSSKYVGVYWDKISNKWKSQIRINKKIYIGSFDTELEAHNAYLNKLEEIGLTFVDNI